MLIENEFTVAAPLDFMWGYLLDIEKIAPCMPGAELTEVVDDHTWKGKMNMKFGPVGMSFAGTVVMESRDDAAHRVVLHAKGMEQKGKGAANAGVTSWLEPGAAEGETLVKMQADITLTGAAASMSRGLIPEISKRLTQQFADCLQTSMAAAEAVARPGLTAEAPAADTPPAPTAGPIPSPAAAKPVGGIGLGLAAIGALMRNFFLRLFGRGPKS